MHADDDAATFNEAAQPERQGFDLSKRSESDPTLLPWREQVLRLGRALAGPRVQPVLVGPPGVGKTAIATVLARAMIERDRDLAPEALHGRRVILVISSRLHSGALYARHLEHKLEMLVDKCKAEDAILFLDDLPSFLGTSSAAAGEEGDVATCLGPHIGRAEIRVLGATTPDGWKLVQQRSPTMAAMFTPIEVPEPPADDVQRMLQSRAEGWKRDFGVVVSPDGLQEAIALAERLYPWKRLPGKVAQMLDASLALTERAPVKWAPPPPVSVVRLRSGVLLRRRASDGEALPVLHRAEIARAVRTWLRLPAHVLDPHVALSRDEVLATLRADVLSQEQVIGPVAERLLMIKAGLCSSDRPLATWLLAGPTGSGKTLLARTVAKLLLGDEERLIRFDMTEYATPEAAARFTGQSATRRRSFGLVDAALVEPFPVILLDEIEKAHWTVYDVLLQVMGEGRLTDDAGRTACFSNAVVMMTSNVGHDVQIIDVPPATPELLGARLDQAVRAEFRPEFIGRLTDVLPFRHLDAQAVKTIAQRELALLVRRRGFAARNIRLRMTHAAIEAVVQAGYSRRYGARPMQRAVERLVGGPAGAWLSANPTAEGVVLRLGLGAGGAMEVVALRPEAAVEAG